MARNLSRQPEKASALAFLARAREVHRGAARGFQNGLQPSEARKAEGQEPSTLHRRLLGAGRQIGWSELDIVLSRLCISAGP